MDVNWIAVLGIGVGVVSALGAVSAAINTYRASKRAAFEQRFTLLLEQHNKLVDKVAEDALIFIDSKNSKFYDAYDLEKSSERLHGNPIFSPYMRVLYHILKYVDEFFYLNDYKNFYFLTGREEEYLKEQKQYTSVLRSFIPNNVLFLIAINSAIIRSNDDGIWKCNDYHNYQRLLIKFSIFEHADFNDEKFVYRKSDSGSNNKSNTLSEMVMNVINFRGYQRYEGIYKPKMVFCEIDFKLTVVPSLYYIYKENGCNEVKAYLKKFSTRKYLDENYGNHLYYYYSIDEVNANINAFNGEKKEETLLYIENKLNDEITGVLEKIENQSVMKLNP